MKNPPHITRSAASMLPCLTLCAVALLQQILAHTCRLSPWKGGGFGMFSSADAPDMRVIAASCTTIDAKNAVVILRDGDLGSMSAPQPLRQLSTLPLADSLSAIALTCIRFEYVATHEERSAILNDFLSANPHVSSSPRIRPNQLVLRPYRPQSADDMSLGRHSLDSLTLSLWRLHFDGVAVRCEPLLPPVCKRRHSQ